MRVACMHAHCQPVIRDREAADRESEVRECVRCERVGGVRECEVRESEVRESVRCERV